MHRAKASVPTPTTAQWLGPEDNSSSGSEEREAGPPIVPSSMRDSGSSVRNQGFTPSVTDHVPVLKYSQVFPDHRSNRDVQIIGVDSYNEFEHKSSQREGILLATLTAWHGGMALWVRSHPSVARYSLSGGLAPPGAA
eukprot:10410212-Karenia_brevis.AAC.1